MHDRVKGRGSKNAFTVDEADTEKANNIQLDIGYGQLSDSSGRHGNEKCSTVEIDVKFSLNHFVVLLTAAGVSYELRDAMKIG